MRTAIITSDQLRHTALIKLVDSSIKINLCLAIQEVSSFQEVQQGPLMRSHMHSRSIVEKDIFGLFIETNPSFKAEIFKAPRGWSSSVECIELLRSRKIDQILVFGSSILRGDIIRLYRGKILNLHLGLSPYYRGSGTNFFPFVNNEPEYCGATFMFLDEGIDTGPIIHQLRPDIDHHDSFHLLSCRFLLKAFKIYIELAHLHQTINVAGYDLCNSCSTSSFRYYRRRDFTEDSVRRLLQNFHNGILGNYLSEMAERTTTVPIIENNSLGALQS